MCIMWITLFVICTFREHLVNQDLVDWQEQKDQWSVDMRNCWTIHTIFWVPQSILFSKWVCQSTLFKNSSCNVSLVDCILYGQKLMNCTLQRLFTITCPKRFLCGKTLSCIKLMIWFVKPRQINIPAQKVPTCRFSDRSSSCILCIHFFLSSACDLILKALTKKYLSNLSVI